MVTQNGDSPLDDDPVVHHAESQSVASIVRPIVQTVAAKRNVPTTELAPLYNRIDPEALGALLEHGETRQSELRVEFRYEGCRVVVSEDGRIRVSDA